MTPTARINRHRSLAYSFVLVTFLACVPHTHSETTVANYPTIESTTIDDTNVTQRTTSLPASTPTAAATTSASSTTRLITTTVGSTQPTSTLTVADDKPKDNNDVVIDSSNHVNIGVPALVTPVSNTTTASELIDLSHKNITALQGLLPDFRTFQVRLLNLSANHLQLIPAAVFARLSTLRCLDLADNNVSHIQAKAFANLTSLQHLNLSRNSLTSLRDETFKGLSSLQQLDLSFNDLTSIAPGALELSSLTRLVLAGNQRLGTNGESPLFIATGRRLQTMDATLVSLGQVPSALTHSIRTLHLAENHIQIVRRGEMDSYPLLQLLDLSWNDLVQVEEDALGRLEMLTILYLTNNRLAEIPHSLPERLKVLHLERNLITALTPTDLEGLTQLEVLLLTGNHIRKISDGAFVQVPNMVTLDLSQNPIVELPAGSLTGPLKLRVLRLSQLNVSMATVKEAAFPLPETEFLITLDLSGSPVVARQWLEDTAALAAARELQELDLSGCAIRTLPVDTLHYLPQLRSLHLRDNALNCTGLEWLAEWMRLQEVAEHRAVYCQSPGDLWGTLLVDLQSLQAANIDEKQPPTRAPSVKTEKQVVDNILNPFAMNILRPEAHASTLLPTVASSQVRKKLNRIMADENDILDATIKSISWPKAIKSVTGAPPPSTRGIFTNALSTPAARRNLFMKKSSDTSAKPPEYANDHKPVRRKDIKSLSLTELRQHENTAIAGHTEASMYLSSTSSADEQRAHPGMYLLIVGIMGAALVLITLTSRMSRRTREDLQILRAYPHDQHDGNELIEVGSLSSVTELW